MSGSRDSDKEDTTDKTAVIQGEQETLNQELQKAREQEACLIIIRGKPQGHRFFLTQKEMVIGRDPTADISINDPSISRKHAKLVNQNGEVTIFDLGSSNGTVINGKKVTSNDSAKLGKEDMIKLGNTILKFLPKGELEILVYGNLESAAHKDPLTGVYNKGYLQEALEAEFKRAKALHLEFSVLFFDLDHFKKINDDYGHDAGDYVLKEFTSLVRGKYLRPKDVFARYGGEEFVVLVSGGGSSLASQLAESIRGAVQKHPFIYEGKKIPVTVSIGVAEASSAVESSQTLLKVADKALYEAKNTGRNKVVIGNA